MNASPIYKPEFSKQQTRVLLEGLSCLEQHLQSLIEKTTDQDDRIDISNDLLYVSSLRKQLEADASKIFGPGLLVQLYPKE